MASAARWDIGASVVVEWVYIVRDLAEVMIPLAGLALGWIAFRTRRSRGLAVTSASWGVVGFFGSVVLQLGSAVDAISFALWFFVAPCLVGGAGARLGLRRRRRDRFVGQR